MDPDHITINTPYNENNNNAKVVIPKDWTGYINNRSISMIVNVS